MHAYDRNIVEFMCVTKFYAKGQLMGADGLYAGQYKNFLIQRGSQVFIRVDRTAQAHIEFEVVEDPELTSYTFRINTNDSGKYLDGVLKKVHKFWQHDGDMNQAYLIRKY